MAVCVIYMQTAMCANIAIYSNFAKYSLFHLIRTAQHPLGNAWFQFISGFIFAFEIAMNFTLWNGDKEKVLVPLPHIVNGDNVYFTSYFEDFSVVLYNPK